MFWNVTGWESETQQNTCKETLPYTVHITLEKPHSNIFGVENILSDFLVEPQNLWHQKCPWSSRAVAFISWETPHASWLWWMGGRAELVCILLPTSSLLCPCVPELPIRLHLSSHSPEHSVFRLWSPVLWCLKTMSARWGSPGFDWWAKGARERLAGRRITFPRHPHLCNPQPESPDITRLSWPSSYT